MMIYRKARSHSSLGVSLRDLAVCSALGGSFVILLFTGCFNISEVKRGGENSPTLSQLFAFGSTGSGPGLFIRPTDITIDLEGFLYVCDTGNNRIQKFSKDGEYLAEFGAFGEEVDRLAYPTALATSGVFLFVADERNERVVQYSRFGTFSGTLLESNSVGRFFPTGIAISKGGEVFVTDREGDRVIVTDLTGKVRRIFGKGGGRAGDFLDPTGIALGGDGLVYVSDTGNGRIQILDPFGGPVRVITSSLSQPRGISIDRGGNLFVTDLDEIKIFDRMGNPLLVLHEGEDGAKAPPLQKISEGNLQSPTGIFITREDRLYICDTGNDRVVVYQLTYNAK